jgi:hypothetical protein
VFSLVAKFHTMAKKIWNWQQISSFLGFPIAKLNILRPESPIFHIKFSVGSQKIERSINLSRIPYFVRS